MCLQDLWISQYIAHNYTFKSFGAGTSVPLVPPNPRRFSLGIFPGNGVTSTSTAPQPIVQAVDAIAIPLQGIVFNSVQWGTLVKAPWYVWDSGEGGYATVCESFLTLPLEEILARYNQEFRKANGIDSWVPNLPLPPTITPNSSQPSKRY
jgi:hypothetical protein